MNNPPQIITKLYDFLFYLIPRSAVPHRLLVICQKRMSVIGGDFSVVCLDKEIKEADIFSQMDKMKSVKIIIEKHAEGYVGYPLGLKGVVVGEGNTYEEALADVQSAIRSHIETFGPDIFEDDSPVLEAFVAEAGAAA